MFPHTIHFTESTFDVHGLLFAGISRADRLGRTARTGAARLVLLSCYPVAGVASVDADNVAAGRSAAQHLPDPATIAEKNVETPY